MPRTYTINGVPQSIAMDAWWMTSDVTNDELKEPKKGPFFGNVGHWGKSLGGLIFLILLGDFLFWGARPGFTLALFAMAIFGVAVASQTERGNFTKPALLLLLSVMPVIEHVQLLSVSIMLIGGSCALGWLTVKQDGGLKWIAAAAVKLICLVPVSGALSLIVALENLRVNSKSLGVLKGLRVGSIWRNWAFPAGGAFILGSLLITANPVLEQFVTKLFYFDAQVFPPIQRVMFWFGLGLWVWPLINPPKPYKPLVVTGPTRHINIGLNCGSVLRALILFNAFLLIQSILDVSILLAGADLPENMTYATYAHRGAYPLLITAMLAGAFTFAARPFLNEHRWIKPLLALWVAQNVLLTLSSVLRLELYISEYGLTYLRIYALIWMGLVAVGLVVVLWHVFRAKPSMLLLGRLVTLGFGTLYLCAFVNFAGIIASHTMVRAADPDFIGRIDWAYLCDLGPTAHKAIEEGLTQLEMTDRVVTLHSCHPRSARRPDWRELDFRTLRTRGYLLE